MKIAMYFPQTKHDFAIRCVGLIVAVWLTQGWLAGNPALASCGDYVTVGGRHGGGGTQGRDREPAAERSGDSHRVPTCSGPQCQRKVPLPATPKHVFPSGSHDSAYSQADAIFTRPQRSTRISELTLLTSQAVILPPDRPPRAAS